MQMHMHMPELPQRVITAMLIIAIGQLILAAGGGWVLYRSAITHMEFNSAQTIERLEEKIDANGRRIDDLGERIDRNADLIRHNGELIAQLRERAAAVEARIGGLEEVVRFFHPPGSGPLQNP